MKKGISIVTAYYNRRVHLVRTLESIRKTKYDKSKLEIIVVNDASDDEHSVSDIPVIFPDLSITVHNIKKEDKKWTNSCIPFNIGFSLVKYDKVIIQSPECYHNGDILTYVDNNLTDDKYLTFGCYSLTYDQFLTYDYDSVEKVNERFKNTCGAGWYNHSVYCPNHLHFCSSMSYKNLCRLNGFDEEYRNGFGYDDNEFLYRIRLMGLKTEIVDDPYVYHQCHISNFHIYASDTKSREDSIMGMWEINKELFKKTVEKKSFVSEKNQFFVNKKMTVLIAFRNREENLKVFVPYFHNFMKNNFPEIKYEIVVIEQGNNKLFNKGILFNIGYLLTSGNTDYYTLHDVDQLPISADYSYNDEPCHLCVNALEQGTDGVLKNPYIAEKYQHKGGAITVSREHYEMANGHSNMYWGWGLIDDDFSFRLFDIGHHLQRYGTRMNHGGLENNDKGYYVTLCAKTNRFHSDENYKRNYNYALGVVNRTTNWRLEGLNTTKFNIIDIVKNEGYTKYIVDFENDVNR